MCCLNIVLETRSGVSNQKLGAYYKVLTTISSAFNIKWAQWYLVSVLNFFSNLQDEF